MKLGNNVDFNLNQAIKIVVEVLASEPAGTEGRLYFNSTTNLLGYYDGSAWVYGGGITALTGDVTASGSGSVAATVAFVGGASAANVADAVTKRHTQHTDTGTTNTTFQLNSGSSGVKLKDSSGELQARNSADNAYADARVKDLTVTGNTVIDGNLTVSGTNTILNTTTLETGDNEIVLNSEITTASGNTTGGIAIKRFHSDDTTRRDATLLYNEMTDRWELTFGAHTSAQVTKTAAAVHAETIGDTSATQFTITHNLNSEDVSVTVRYAAGTKEMILTDWRVTSENAVRVDFAVAPGTNEFRVIVQG